MQEPKITTSSQQPQFLVLQTAFLGDVLLSIPLLKNIRMQFPSAKIHYVSRQGLGKILLDLKVIDFAYEIQKGQSQSYQKIRLQLRLINFENIYCPHESLRSAFFVLSLQAKKKTAFNKWWNNIFFSSRIEKIKSLPEALRQLQMLQAENPEIREKIVQYASQYEAGEIGAVPDWASMTVQYEKRDRQSICIFPGSVWQTKKWTLEGFSNIAKKLSEANEVILLGGKEESDLGEAILKAAPNVKNKIGQTSVQESLHILAGAKLVITNDSGGQHMAALVDAPTVSIFGPTVLEFGYRPWNEKVIVVENNKIQCRPCGSHGHQKCPLGTHECMRSISTEQVMSASEKLLGIN